MNGSNYLDNLSDADFAELQAATEARQEWERAEELNAAADTGYCPICGCPLDGKEHYTCHAQPATATQAADDFDPFAGNNAA